MRPLAASLVFIIIAMIVGVFRQLLFTNTGSASDDSNIALTKIHTLTVAQHSDSKLSFNSLY
jgi:ADP-ribosylglycohydrolase